MFWMAACSITHASFGFAPVHEADLRLTKRIAAGAHLQSTFSINPSSVRQWFAGVVSSVSRKQDFCDARTKTNASNQPDCQWNLIFSARARALASRPCCQRLRPFDNKSPAFDLATAQRVVEQQHGELTLSERLLVGSGTSPTG
jgi:hypothetical protein